MQKNLNSGKRTVNIAKTMETVWKQSVSTLVNLVYMAAIVH